MKKFLNFDAILCVLFLVGCTVASIALVCNGFNELQMDGYPVWMATSMKVVGFSGTITFPMSLKSLIENKE